MFTDKLEVVQYDAAKRILRTLWKDLTFEDKACQSASSDIDSHLINQLAFYKTEVGRLIQEAADVNEEKMKAEKKYHNAMNEIK